MKKLVVLLLVFIMVLALCGCGKNKEVKDVEAQIESLTKIGLPNEDGKIQAVREAYNSLTVEEQGEVENYEVLLDIEYKNDFALLERYLWSIIERSEAVIDLYSKISSTAYAEASWIGANRAATEQHYFDCIMAVAPDTTWESWTGNKMAWPFDSNWVDVFRLGVLLCPENPVFNFSSYEDFQDITFAFINQNLLTNEPIKIPPEEHVPEVFARAYEQKYNYVMLMMEDGKAYDTYESLYYKYGDTHKEELDAIDELYFAVSEGAYYVLNPSDSTPNLIKGWIEISKDIEMAERAYKLKR